MNNNTRMGLVISLFKFKSFDQFNPPKLPQILDIYSVVALQVSIAKISCERLLLSKTYITT